MIVKVRSNSIADLVVFLCLVRSLLYYVGKKRAVSDDDEHNINSESTSHFLDFFYVERLGKA